MDPDLRVMFGIGKEGRLGRDEHPVCSIPAINLNADRKHAEYNFVVIRRSDPVANRWQIGLAIVVTGSRRERGCCAKRQNEGCVHGFERWSEESASAFEVGHFDHTDLNLSLS